MWLVIAYLSLFLSEILNSVASRNCTQKIALDNIFDLDWNPPEDKKGDSKITFKVQFKTNGYFVLGISSRGGIPGSDFVTGWIDDGEVYFQDRHADASGMLHEDDQQDYQLINAYENDTLTVFEFRRKLDTCDGNDMVIGRNTYKIIYAYSDEDPQSGEPLSLDNPQSKSVILLQCNIENDLDIDFSSLLQWNLTAPDVDISSVNTLYWCKIYKSPQVSEKHHIIYVKPMIQDGHEEFVSHMALYECVGGRPEDYEDLLDDSSFQCYEPSMPVQMFRCQSLTVTWTTGSEGIPLPPHAGFPIHSTPRRYYMFEMHYSNPQLLSGIIDHSGLCLYYTPNLRNYDAGYYLVAPSPLPRLFIPPGQEEYVVAGHSNPECGSWTFPESAVKVVAATLNTFYLGRRFTIRQFRENQELVQIADDKNFDTNYRPYRFYTEDVYILPNDHLTVECTYNSSERKNVTFGGLGTEHELCVAALIYYPCENRSIVSFSAPSFASINKVLNTNITNESDVFRVLGSYNWSSVDIDEVQNDMRYSQHQTQCFVGEFLEDGEHTLTSYPKDIIPYEEDSVCDVTT